VIISFGLRVRGRPEDVRTRSKPSRVAIPSRAALSDAVIFQAYIDIICSDSNVGPSRESAGASVIASVAVNVTDANDNVPVRTTCS
jgi:hypothetical protein